ncbi:hypothetical protein [Ichthyobacterium seriolicida]|uniref:Uncharacterized protein n=1 Tax=Ichthyobacterium seriolicida TaxID=242600 RepID=A0A1J1DWH0_9FLAO|nr:hypothetical protein [Ichthyobacterium seriolicida]BAV94202.1 hypothetical protein JBKA6_0189 [Ichthyobacterium seriolicida]
MKKIFKDLLVMLASGVIVFSCDKDPDDVAGLNGGEVEIKSVSFLKDKNKVEGKEELTELYKGLFIKKTPSDFSKYSTAEEKALSSKIEIKENDIYVNIPYNQVLKVKEVGNLNATVTLAKVPTDVTLVSSSTKIASTTFDIPIRIGACELSHDNLKDDGVITKNIRFSKKVGSKNVTFDYFVHFQYDKKETKSAKCDLFTTTTANAPITQLSFTRDYQISTTLQANNSYVCENAIAGHAKCDGFSKSGTIVTPVLTSVTSGKGDTKENPIELHFEGGTYTSTSGNTTTFNSADTQKGFDVAHIKLNYKTEKGKEHEAQFTMPNFTFIADGAVLPDGAFFSTEGLEGTNCGKAYKQRICPKDPSKPFRVSNPLPGANNGIIFKVVAQNGTSEKFYKLIFKNKYNNTTAPGWGIQSTVN